jgi:hypothetical protein
LNRLHLVGNQPIAQVRADCPGVRVLKPDANLARADPVRQQENLQ